MRTLLVVAMLLGSTSVVADPPAKKPPVVREKAVTGHIVKVESSKPGTATVTIDRGEKHGVKKGWVGTLKNLRFEIVEVTDTQSTTQIDLDPGVIFNKGRDVVLSPRRETVPID